MFKLFTHSSTTTVIFVACPFLTLLDTLFLFVFNMTVTLTADEIAKLKGSDPDKRYMVVYNGTDETVSQCVLLAI